VVRGGDSSARGAGQLFSGRWIGANHLARSRRMVGEACSDQTIVGKVTYPQAALGGGVGHRRPRRALSGVATGSNLEGHLPSPAGDVVSGRAFLYVTASINRCAGTTWSYPFLAQGAGLTEGAWLNASDDMPAFE